MKRSTFSLILIGLLLLAGLLMALTVLSPKISADATAVDAANNLYMSGHYAEAVQLYEEQVARGVQDSTLFYNLGNAYFQQGDLGRAVLNLKRAAQLNPRDADIENNLALVREQTTELFTEEAEVFGTMPVGPLAVLAEITGWMTENETAVLVLGFWFLLGFLILVRRQVKSGKAQKALQVGAVLALAVLVISGASLASRAYLQQTQPAGVVVSPTVAVSDGPGAEFNSDFNLSGGTTVKIAETQGAWVRLALPEGAGERWLPVEAISPVA
jgi:tetratricopeptide (TPR) repeat protein